MSGWTHRECSGCGSQFCDGRCFLECEADYEDDLTEQVERELRRTMEIEDARRRAA